MIGQKNRRYATICYGISKSPYRSMGVLISVWVDVGYKVPVKIIGHFRMGSIVLNQLAHYPSDNSGGNPFTGMNTFFF